MSNIDLNDFMKELCSYIAGLEMNLIELDKDKIRFFKDLQKVIIRLDSSITKSVYEWEEENDEA